MEIPLRELCIHHIFSECRVPMFQYIPSGKRRWLYTDYRGWNHAVTSVFPLSIHPEDTSITDDHFLILNPNLNRCAKHITVMSNCIVDYFADCLTRSMLRHLYRGHSGSICPRGSIAPDGCQITARRHHSFAEIGRQPCFYLLYAALKNRQLLQSFALREQV